MAGICSWSQHNSPSGFSIFMIDGARYPCHRHAGFHEFLVIAEGRFRHRLNGQLLTHQEREILLIRESDEHELLGGKCRIINIPFSLRWLECAEALTQSPGLLHDLLHRPSPPLLKIDTDVWPDVLSDIRRLLTEADTARARLLFPRLFLRLIQDHVLETARISEPTAPMPQWLWRLIREVDEHPHVIHGVSDLARLSSRTPEHLARCFRTYLDITPSRFLNDRRMQRAAHLLLTTNLRSASVAVQIGIEDPAYFNRLFKNRFSVSPGEYRQTHGVVMPLPVTKD